MNIEDLQEKSRILTRGLQAVEAAVGVAGLFVLFVVIIVNIFTRYLLDMPLAWSDELCNYLFIWMSFLASAYVMGNDGHIRVTAIESRLPEKARRAVHLAMNVIMLVMFSLYILPSFRMLGKLKKSNMLEIPLKYVYVIMPVCFFLMCVHIAVNIVGDIRGFSTPEKGKMP